MGELLVFLFVLLLQRHRLESNFSTLLSSRLDARQKLLVLQSSDLLFNVQGFFGLALELGVDLIDDSVLTGVADPLKLALLSPSFAQVLGACGHLAETTK
jgi:hypothetical protein